MMNVLALERDGEQFVLMYDDESVQEALKAVQRHARDPGLAFNEDDARLFGARIISRWAEVRAARPEN